MNEEQIIKELREIEVNLKTSTSDFQRGFLEGLAVGLTMHMDEHPEWWNNACGCRSCMSYGEPVDG